MLDLANFLPYLRDGHGIALPMWRVLAALEDAAEQPTRLRA